MAYDEFGIFDTDTPDISKQGVTSDILRGQKPRKQSTSISLAPWAQSTPFTAEDRLPVSRAPQRSNATRGPALPRARAQAAPKPDNLMSEYDDLQLQQAELQAQQAKAWEEPDYESTRRMGRERALGGDSAMLMSLMAQESGEQFKPQSAHYLKQAASMREPMKVTGGQIMEDGSFFQDPGYAKELEAKRIDARVKQIDQQLQQNLTMQERRRLQEEKFQQEERMARIVGAIAASNRQQPAGQIITDAEGNASLVDTRTGAIKPLGRIGAPKEGGKLTGEERSAQGYLSRMRAAEAAMQDPELAGFDAPSGPEIVAGWIPKLGPEAANALRGTNRQQVYQAQEDWVRAKLRKESGAVIGDEEMAREIRTYFPLLTDGPEVRAQKAQARREAERQMEIMGNVEKRDLVTGGGHPMSPPAASVPRSNAPAPGVNPRTANYYSR